MEEVIFIAIALAVSWGLTWMLRRAGPKLGIMDTPSELSIHSRPIPRIGGIAICSAFTLAMIVAIAIPGYLDPGQKFSLLVIMMSSLIVCGTGLLADTGKMSVIARFLFQAIAAAIVVWFGIKVQVVPLAYVAVLLTLLYLMGGVNSVNLLDGMDGLAAGIAAIASIFFLTVSIIQGNALTGSLAASLLGACLGFLRFNLHRADIFMGDGGSYFLGFILAGLAVLLTSKPYNERLFLAPILILGVPIFDTALAILRRLLNRKTMFAGDRRHLYDLMRSRLGHAGTLAVMYGLSVILGLTALFLVITSVSRTLGISLVIIEILVLLLIAFKLKAFQAEPVTGDSNANTVIRPGYRPAGDGAGETGAANPVSQHRSHDPEV